VSAHLLGAHVSTAGGIEHAPARGKAIGANAIQVFTKTPNQWREPVVTDERAAAFQNQVQHHGIRAVVAHDSYLINLASPDPALRRRSTASFIGELTRCRTLGIPWVVTHPGNYMDDRTGGLERNVTAYAECLATVDGPSILIETTAGSGTALGSRFEELAALRAGIPTDLRARVGFCADTAHLHAAGYDLHDAAPDIWTVFDRTVGLQHLRCLHLNDSKAPMGSRRDRHEWIAEGTIGAGPFRRIMQDPRLRDVIKIIETPKADDPERHDRRMLRRLRTYARRARQPGG
jgi:deoxyribonuclease-4